jgi:serine O-acetyltransferase
LSRHPTDPTATHHDRILGDLTEDVRTAMAKDPAATGPIAVALLYPGLHAVRGYRIAHAR